MQIRTRRFLWLLLTSMALLLVCLAGCVTSTPTLMLEPGPVCLPTATSTPIPGAHCSPAATPTSTPTIEISLSDKNLVCEILLSMQWGAGPDELGYVVIERWKKVSGPYPPVFDETGRMFIADPVNNRILMYDHWEFQQLIPIPESYVLEIGGYEHYWSPILATNDRIFLSFSEYHEKRIVDRVAIIDLQGTVERVIDLEPYYPIHSIYHPLRADWNGGFYLLLDPVGMVHFDSQYRAKFVALGSDWQYYYMEIGWDKNIYTYSPSKDYISVMQDSKNTSMLHMSPPLRVIENITNDQTGDQRVDTILGITQAGEIYVLIEENQIRSLLIITNDGEKREKVQLPTDFSSGFIASWFRLAPDGSLVGLIYDVDDAQVSPQVIRCTLKTQDVP